MLTFVFDSREIGIWKGPLERALIRTLSKSGGDAIRGLRAEGKRQIRQRTRIRAGYLADKSLPLTFPRGKQTLDGLVWVMRVSGKAVPLGEFPSRQTKKGVSVEVARGSGRKVILGAFMAQRKDGRQGVFIRPTNARYPMGHRLGLSVSDSMSDGKIPTSALNRAGTVFGASFSRLLPLELAKVQR